MLDLAPYLPLSWAVLALQIAILAYAVSAVMMQPGKILWWYARLIDPLPLWLKNPIGYCESCLAGQIAFWLFLLLAWPHWQLAWFGLLFIGLTVFFTALISRLWE